MSVFRRLARYADLIPIGLVLVLTFSFTMDVPVSDDWDLVPIIQKMREGTLDWGTLDAPYAGHKFAIPWLALASVAVATHWNSYVFRLINLLIFAGAWGAIRPAAVREGRLLETSLVFWSWTQWAAWLWTFTMCCTMAFFCVLWSLRLLELKRWANFILAMILAVAGTLCHGAGLAVWPAAFYLLFFTPSPLAQRIVFGAILTLAMYLFLHHPAAQAHIVRGKNYLQMPFYFFEALGGPVGFAKAGMAALVSLGGLLMLVFCVSWQRIRSRPFIVALLAAGLAMAGLLTIARGGGDTVIQALDSRYGTMAVLFWVGVVLLVDWTGWKRWALALMMALVVVRSLTRIPDMERYRQAEEAEAAGLLGWTPKRFSMEGAQTTPDQLDADERLLRQWHYSLFRDR